MKDIAARILLTVRDGATAPLRGIRRQFTGLRGVVVSLGAAFATYFSGRAVVGFFQGIVSEAADLEQALSRVSAVTRATPPEMDKLKASAQEMGATTRYTASEAASAMEALGRAGLDTSETIAALPSVLALAQGNSLDLARSAQVLTQAAAGMGVAFEDAGRLADIFSLAAASSNTNVDDLATAFSYAAPTARAIGMEVEELASYIGQLANSAIDASRAGTGLNNMFTQFMNPASTFRKELGALGITTDDFSEALRQLEKAGPRAEKAILSVGQRSGPALRALLNNGIGAVDELTAALYNSEGAAAEAAARMDDNLRGAMVALGSAWSAVKQYLGEPLLGKLKDEADGLAASLRKAATDGSLERLRDSIVQAFEGGMTAIKGFVTSFGSAEEVITKLTTGFATTMEWMGRIGTAGKLAGNLIVAAFKGVDAAVSAVAAVITKSLYWVTTGMARVTRGLYHMGMASLESTLKMDALAETLGEAADELGIRMVESAIEAGKAVGSAVENMGELTAGAKDATKATTTLGDATETLEGKANLLKDASLGNAAALMAWTEKAWETAKAQRDVGAASEETGASLADMRERIREAQEQLLELIRAGARVEEIEAASRRLEVAQRDLRDALTGTGTAAEETAEDLDDLEDETTDAVDATEALIKSVRDTGKELGELGKKTPEINKVTTALQRMAELDRLRNMRTELGKLHRDGKITSEEHAKAVAEIDKQMRQLIETTKELKGGNEELAKSYDKVTKAAGGGGDKPDPEPAKARGARGLDYSSITSLSALERLLKERNQSPPPRMDPKYGNYFRSIWEEEVDQIKARIAALKAERAAADEATRATQAETSARVANTQQQAPVRTVRIELGGAVADVPEAQADAFIRQLQQLGSRSIAR